MMRWIIVTHYIIALTLFYSITVTVNRNFYWTVMKPRHLMRNIMRLKYLYNCFFIHIGISISLQSPRNRLYNSPWNHFAHRWQLFSLYFLFHEVYTMSFCRSYDVCFRQSFFFSFSFRLPFQFYSLFLCDHLRQMIQVLKSEFTKMSEDF